MQSVSSRIWTRVAVFISYDENYYTTVTTAVMDNETQFQILDEIFFIFVICKQIVCWKPF